MVRPARKRVKPKRANTAAHLTLKKRTARAQQQISRSRVFHLVFTKQKLRHVPRSKAMEKMRKRNIWLMCALLIGIVAAGCNQKKISEVLAHPEHFRDDDVVIQGRVTSSFNVGGIGAAYEVDDGTGRIWVFTRNHPAPPEHVHIYVGGRVETAVTFGQRTLGIALHEKGRRLGY